MNDFIWLVRREFWENKAIWVMPACIGGLMVVAGMFGNVEISTVHTKLALLRTEFALLCAHFALQLAQPALNLAELAFNVGQLFLVHRASLLRVKLGHGFVQARHLF